MNTMVERSDLELANQDIQRLRAAVDRARDAEAAAMAEVSKLRDEKLLLEADIQRICRSLADLLRICTDTHKTLKKIASS
jgi:hypothetical protein